MANVVSQFWKAMIANFRPILPAMDAAAITPSNTVAIVNGAGVTQPCRAIYVGTTGNINIVLISGATQLFSNVPVGIFAVGADQVLSTNTTASNLVALF